MNRLLLLFIVAIAAGAAGFLFQVKYRVQDLERELARLNDQILADRESVHVLKTEWSYLNQPERISALAQRHLEMEPMEPLQVAFFDILPPRPEDFGYAQADLDKALPEPRPRPPASRRIQVASASDKKILASADSAPIEPGAAHLAPEALEPAPSAQPIIDKGDDIGAKIAQLMGGGSGDAGPDSASESDGQILPASAGARMVQ